MYILSLLLAVAIAVLGDLYDVIMTEKGLKAGVAIEGNTWLVGSKPSALALYLRDGLVLSVCLTPTILAASFGNMPLAYGFLASPVAFGAKHFLGGRAWAKLGVKL